VTQENLEGVQKECERLAGKVEAFATKAELVALRGDLEQRLERLDKYAHDAAHKNTDDIHTLQIKVVETKMEIVKEIGIATRPLSEKLSALTVAMADTQAKVTRQGGYPCPPGGCSTKELGEA
jgi:hypothetical protein